jgi:hypothetical protein
MVFVFCNTMESVSIARRFRMRYIPLKSIVLLLAAVLAVVPLGCKSHTKVGKLVGVSVQMSGSEAMSGHIDNLGYLGTVTVRLEDDDPFVNGTTEDAVCDGALMKTLHGGQRLEIEPLDDKVKWKDVKWKVVRALD